MSAKLSLTWAHEGRVSYVHILFISCNKLFLYTTNGQQSNLICCHNDTLKCSTSRLHNYFKCLWNCECYVPCCASSSLLLILGSLGAIIIAQCARWSPDYKMWNHSISMYTGRYWWQSFWNEGLFPPTAEVSGFLEYQIHVEGIVLCFWSSLSCIKTWIAVC